jgi:transcriptional regulator GlxA family with amidase domain
MFRVLILALDGVFDSSLSLTLDALATADRLAIAKQQSAGFSATLFHPGRRQIRTGMGGRFSVESEVRIQDFDALIVPGLGLATAEALEPFFSARSNRLVVDWLRDAGRDCPLIAASCSAVFMLAEAGLLQGKTATTTWWLGSVFRERYPDIDLDETRMLVESDGILCAGAALAQIDLMLHLIARASSPGLSREVARYLAIERRPSQARYMMLSAVAGMGQDVSDIERWIRVNRSRSFSMAELAKALGMSTRTLDRRVRLATGRGPARFVQRLRLEHASHLIETSQLSLDEIAGRVGYRDSTTLRRLMRRHLDVNPTEMRRRSA